MPRSRRNISSSSSSNGKARGRNLQKSTKERKLETIESVQKALRAYPNLFLYQLENPRNSFFQRLRRDLSETSIFWLGKNKVLQKALGKNASSAFVAGADQVSSKITGNTGILFTKLSRAELEDVLSGYSLVDYARAGSICHLPITIVPKEDKVLCRMDSGEPISATQETILRIAGMPTMLRGGAVLLASGNEFKVCEAGDKLTSNQAKILKVFGIQTDEFSVKLLARFDCGTGKLEEYK